MDTWKLISAVTAIIVAVTSILAIWPDETNEGGGELDINLSGMENRYNYVTPSSPEDVSFKIQYKAKRIDTK